MKNVIFCERLYRVTVLRITMDAANIRANTVVEQL